jgi:hypothetical protein
MKKNLLLCLIFVLCLTAFGCKKKDGLVGEWVYATNDNFVFNFKEDMTCSYAGRNCTYTVDNEKLSILYEGDTNPFETTFKISDGKLTIKDSFNNDVVYNKK